MTIHPFRSIFVLICTLFFSVALPPALAADRQTISPATLPTEPKWQTIQQAGPECVAVMSSFPRELDAIESVMVPDASNLQTTRINGVEFKWTTVGRRHYLFFLSGMSMVNAAMNTQLALDHFNIRALFFTGIAGGIDPANGPGDVVVPARWHYHSEAAYFNQTAPGKFAVADWFKVNYENFGMIFPEDVTVRRDGMADWEQVPTFAADPQLLSAAKKSVSSLPSIKTGDRVCQVTFGGDGVSGTVFCDNADYRKWIFKVWKAQCVDMESTAIAQVCWQNKTPCLIVRGLSDLAGGQAGQNQLAQYLTAAADNSARVLEGILQHLDEGGTTRPASSGH